MLFAVPAACPGWRGQLTEGLNLKTCYSSQTVIPTFAGIHPAKFPVEEAMPMLTHNYTYQECLDISKRVSWLEDDVLAGKNLDFSKRFLSNRLVAWG